MKNPLRSLAPALVTFAALALSLTFAACSGDDAPGGKPGAGVASIALSRNTMTLAAGDATGVLAAAVAPADAADKSVKWASDKETVATVSQSGVVTPLAAGRAVITASSADGSKKAECRLEVVAAPIPAVAAAPNKYATIIAPGGREAFAVTFYPYNATNQNLSWRSSDPSIAEVSSTGEVTAKRPGAVTITAVPAQAMSGAAPVQVPIRASGGPAPVVGDGEGGGMDISVGVAADSVAATGVTLNKGAVSLTVGNTETLMPTVQPSDATNQAVNWTSSDASVAVVSSGGVVTALSPGTAAVAVATVDGGSVAACTVTVADAPAEPVHPASVSLDKTALEMWGAALLTPTVLPLNADNRNVYWLTSNPAVAVVSSLGLVTGVAPGTATVTVVTVDGGRAAACAVTVVGAPIAATGVTLNKDYMGLGLGGSERLLETVLPESATNRDVTWASDAPGVATVSNGIVTGASLGTATITVATVDGGHTAACVVTVAANYVQATGVELDMAELALDAGESRALAATVQPEDASNKAVTWASSAPGVAAVSNGLVTALANGAATIIVATADGGFVATCAVTVTTPVSGVILDRAELALDAGASHALAATVLPADASNKAVTWSSSAPGVATVSNGLVTALANGAAAITATTVDGGFVATCSVTVATPVTGVVLDRAELALDVGAADALIATVLPATASNKAVTWASSAPGVATVSNGLVTALANGAAAITVTTADGGRAAACAVTVTTPVSGVILDRAELALDPGESHALAATVLPADASNKAVAWSSSAPGVATVSADGQVAAWANGTAAIIVATADGGFVATCAVTVALPVTDVQLSPDTMILAVGNSSALTATVLPEGASNQNVSWSSSAPSVASVSDGVVTGIADGTAIITVTTQDGGHAAICETIVAVSPLKATHTTLFARGDYGSYAIRADGNIWKWGEWRNANIHVRVNTDSDWVSLCGGDLALKANGSLWEIYPFSSPLRADRVGNGYAGGAQGDRHWLAIKVDGSLWAWGDNQYGQLGLGNNVYAEQSPVRVGTDTAWVSVAAGYNTSSAIKADGSLWAWGDNQYGQLGLGDRETRRAPTRVGADSDWEVAVSTGGNFSMAIKADGSLWAWGYGGYGQLGLDRDIFYLEDPTRVGADGDWAAVSAGDHHTLAIKADGSLWAWGRNSNGQLGLGDRETRRVPTRVGADGDWAAVGAGWSYTLALKADGSLWAWGNNEHGQLGLNITQDVLTPTLVGTGYRVPAN
jgi:uncharacterized protein YjdB/alpha-tubulin suppressor-like RCC1 family protein